MNDPVGGTQPGEAHSGPRLFAIVYISTAARRLSVAELDHLCVRAQARNLEQGVTGLLLYSDGSFMQYLEGPAAGLVRVYGCIKADPLHYGVIDLLRVPLQAREFPAWSMALRDVGVGGRPVPGAQDAQLVAKLAAPAHRSSAAGELLQNFWNRGRSSVASVLTDFSTQRVLRLRKAPSESG